MSRRFNAQARCAVLQPGIRHFPGLGLVVSICASEPIFSAHLQWRTRWDELAAEFSGRFHLVFRQSLDKRQVMAGFKKLPFNRIVDVGMTVNISASLAAKPISGRTNHNEQ
jgi:hypothetical protein